MSGSNKKVFLIILDGWGMGKDYEGNAVIHANTPCFDTLWKKHPHAFLSASGEAVGLPENQMGNSEVGHMNIGAGRIVYQQIGRIHKSIKDGDFFQKAALKQIVDYVNSNHKKLHIMGLVSDGGVHSHIKHLYALLDYFSDKVEKAYIHAFTDGRDTNTNEGLQFIKNLSEKSGNSNAIIASIIGRYYAMDRDKRWERTKKAYDLMVHGKGEKFENPIDAVQHSYAANISDEFIEPKVMVDKNQNPVAVIEEGDAVLCFNFRTDRGRQISTALTQKDIESHGLKKMNLHYSTMTCYSEDYEDVHVVFEEISLQDTLGEILSKHNKTQLRIAETEKYPHVTFFFNGGVEEPIKGEERVLVHSPKVATYDLKPEMSAVELTEALMAHVKKNVPDFICLNFANPDMVGHTGDLEAVKKAVECVDNCLEQIIHNTSSFDYSYMIIADHGNAEYMLNEDGTPNTYHTTNLVPCIVMDKDTSKVSDGKLADIAPTILHLFGIDIPASMNGQLLIS